MRWWPHMRGMRDLLSEGKSERPHKEPKFEMSSFPPPTQILCFCTLGYYSHLKICHDEIAFLLHSLWTYLLNIIDINFQLNELLNLANNTISVTGFYLLIPDPQFSTEFFKSR